MENNDAWTLAENDEAQMRETLTQWGGNCGERAKAILRERRSLEPRFDPDIPCEYKMSAKNFIKYMNKVVKIPDTKSLDDYQLLTTVGIESMRKMVYIPASQNLDKLIMSGQITDIKVIALLRAKMETLRMQLDLYDARLKHMAEEPDPDHAIRDMVVNASYLQDMEKNNLARIQEEMKAEDKLRRYKEYQRSVNPARKITDEELEQKRLVIEQNRSRKKFITDAYDNAENLKFKRSEEADISKRYKEYHKEIDRLFNTDFSELFSIELTETGIIKNCSKKYELAGMLTDLPAFMQTVDNISPVERNRLLHDELLFTETEITHINAYIELGKLVGPYYAKLKEYADAHDEVSFMAASDFGAINQNPVNAEQLKTIDQNEIFVQEAFIESTEKFLAESFANGKGISDVLVPLGKKAEKNRNAAENFKFKEYSFLAIKKMIPNNPVSREALEKQDMNLLSKIALGLTLINDTQLSEKKDDKKNEKKIISAMASILSYFTGEERRILMPDLMMYQGMNFRIWRQSTQKYRENSFTVTDV